MGYLFDQIIEVGPFDDASGLPKGVPLALVLRVSPVFLEGCRAFLIPPRFGPGSDTDRLRVTIPGAADQLSQSPNRRLEVLGGQKGPIGIANAFYNVGEELNFLI